MIRTRTLPARRRRPIAAATLALALALAAWSPGAGIALADEPAPPGDADPLAQTLDRDQTVGTDRTVLDTGHVDIGPRLSGGAWSISIHDDTGSEPIWRVPADVVVRVSDAAKTVAPTDGDYAFLGAAAGHDVWVIPQTQNRDVVWVGWNTQAPDVMERLQRGATFTLHGVTGPGEVLVFLQSGILGAPDLLWSSTEPTPQDLFVTVNTHTHANWVFTEPGVYLVDFEISGTLLGGEQVSDRQPLRFAVGDDTDTDAAFAASLTTGEPAPDRSSDAGAAERSSSPAATADPSPTSDTAAQEAEAGTSSSTTASSNSVTVWLVVALLAAVIAVGIVVTVIQARVRRARAIDHQEDR